MVGQVVLCALVVAVAFVLGVLLSQLLRLGPKALLQRLKRQSSWGWFLCGFSGVFGVALGTLGIITAFKLPGARGIWPSFWALVVLAVCGASGIIAAKFEKREAVNDVTATDPVLTDPTL